MSLNDLPFGRPLAAYEDAEQLPGRITGIGVFRLDALSSAAYGPEAALTLLMVNGLYSSRKCQNGRMTEAPRQTLIRRSDEPKLEIGDAVPIQDGIIGVVVARFTPFGENRVELHYIVELRRGETGKGMTSGRPLSLEDFSYEVGSIFICVKAGGKYSPSMGY